MIKNEFMLTELQKDILNLIQVRFPIRERPYAELARQVAASEEEVMAALEGLKHEGIIRRIGAIFEAKQLGYVSTLIGAHVPVAKIEAFVTAVNMLPGVSHNYGRRHRLNVWFTLTVGSEAVIRQTVDTLKAKYGIDEIHSLPTVRLFKIQVEFSLVEPHAPAEVSPATGQISKCKKQEVKSANTNPKQTEVETHKLNAYQKMLVRELQEDLAGTAEPFAKVASVAGLGQEEVLHQIRQWKQDGTIRRFGASVRHQRLGFTSNGMAVFTVPPDRIEEAGVLLASHQAVSHCYQRPRAPGWPYNLFAMTHCRSEEELREIVQAMADRIHPLEHDVLLTTAEYKKTNVKYFME